MADLGTGVTGYPGEIDTNDSPQTSDNYTDYLTLEGAIAAILALEAELGISPSRSKATVLAYLSTEHDTDGKHVFSGNQSFSDYNITNVGDIALDSISADGSTITINSGLVMADSIDIALNTSTGSKIGTATNQKLGFWNSAPVIQQSSVGETTGFTAGSGTAAKDDSTHTGNVGSTAYTVSDIVKHLKTIGILAS